MRLIAMPPPVPTAPGRVGWQRKSGRADDSMLPKSVEGGNFWLSGTYPADAG
jgi:hypothetical protein